MDKERIMAIVTCTRCKQQRQGLERAPLPGEPGKMILANVCAACWKEWLGTQVKYINEYRLSPLDPKHYEFLLEQAKAFLMLPGADAPAPEPGTPRS
jgi:Fe-S cluster biosynthesis and repair protein YggX